MRSKLIMFLAVATCLLVLSPSVSFSEDVDSSKNNEKLNDYFSHPVFVEFAAKYDCLKCPSYADLIHNLYSTGGYPFYFVTMYTDTDVVDAEGILRDTYNLTGCPTLIFDGGHRVSYNQTLDENMLRDYVSGSGTRAAADLKISLYAGWYQDCCNKKVNINLEIKNTGVERYDGVLKVYITEIDSRWSYFSDGVPKSHSFGFLDFALNENLSIPAGKSIRYQTQWNAVFPSGLSGENLAVFAVLFNAEKHQTYSDPPFNQHPFIAHYVDMVVADRVKGLLPPVWTGVKNPQHGLYVFNKRIVPMTSTLVIGKVTIEVDVSDYVNVDRVEIYVNDKQTANMSTTPFNWEWKEPSFGKKTVTIKTFSKEGFSETLEQTIYKFF